MEKIAVIILNWNGEKHLESLLPLVIKHSAAPGTGIYVADNGSDDNSVALLSASFPGAKQIIFDRNHGFAQGYNLAIEQVEAEYIVLLNSDVEVTPGWLAPLTGLMEKEKDIAACMPKIRSYHQREYFEYAGAAGGFIDRLGYPFCRGRILSEIEKDEGQYNDRKEIFWATGACLMVRRKLFLQAGSLDARFFAHMEEIDLCWRLKNMGYRIVYEPSSVVYHIGGGTLPNEHPGKLYLNFRNNLFTLLKNLPSVRCIPVITLRLCLDLTAAIQYLAGGELAKSLAVIRAHIHFFLSLGRYLKHRRQWKKKYSLLWYPEIYPHSIVYSFFVRKIRRFPELRW